MKNTTSMTIPRTWPLYVAVSAVFLALVSNSLTTTGMFMDGLIYSNVAANMADGIGSFGHPAYTASHHPDFYQHPPLMMGMLALCYKLLGTQLWVTKLYMVLTTVLCGWLIVRLWMRIGGKVENGWMPLFLWTMIPIVTRFANQCMLENTMVLFVLGAILLMLRPCRKALNGLLAGVLLAAAFLTKGFTGLFPLALPLLLWMFDSRCNPFKTMLAQALCMMAGLLLPLAAIALTTPEARVYFENYMQLQVLAGWSQNEVGRLQIVYYALRSIAIVAGIVAVVIILNKGVSEKPNRTYWAMWVMVACAVLPMMVSTRQREFYLLTAMPIVATLAAKLIEKPVARWIRPSRTLPYITISMLLGALVLNAVRFGSEGRDVQLQRDMKVIAPHLKFGEMVTVPTPLYLTYSLQGYYYRECRVSLSDRHRCQRLITTADYPVDSTYHEVLLPTEEYHLYELSAE